MKKTLKKLICLVCVICMLAGGALELGLQAMAALPCYPFGDDAVVRDEL